MINAVRLYLDIKDEVPMHARPVTYPVVVDCDPSDAQRLKRYYQRQGFNVIALPL